MISPERVVIAGDWHGNTPWAVHVIEETGKILGNEPMKVLFQLGDFGYLRFDPDYLPALSEACQENMVNLLFIDGNHESFDILCELRGKAENKNGFGAEIAPMVTWLSRGARWSLGGRRWLALGGATSLDRDMRTEGADYFAEEEITPEQASAIISGGQADVMLTHDCPSSVVHTFPDFGFPVAEIARAERHAQRLNDIVEAVQPEFLVHGHLHICYSRNQFFHYGECQVTGLSMDGEDTNFFPLNVKTLEWEDRP